MSVVSAFFRKPLLKNASKFGQLLIFPNLSALADSSFRNSYNAVIFHAEKARNKEQNTGFPKLSAFA